jgi:hypothetical protein
MCYALDGGHTYIVFPGSYHYLKALEAAIQHSDYKKIKAIYGSGNALVYGFIHDYLGGWNDKPDMINDIIVDNDGVKFNTINNVRLTPREVDVVKGISTGLADK